MRRATIDDAPAMVAQTRAGIATYADFAPAGWTVDQIDPEDHLERIRATLRNPDAEVFIADDGKGYVAWRPEDGFGHLLGLFVDQDAWGSGLATALHARAIGSMRERGFRTARLYTAAGQARGRRFYEREGWRAHGEAAFWPMFGLDVIEYRLDLGSVA
jgi:GNAT superfamily N-acetyltransferase